LIHACSPEDATIIYDNMKIGNPNDPNFKAVKAAYERNYGCLGITCDMVGGFTEPISPYPYYAGAEPCDAASKEKATIDNICALCESASPCFSSDGCAVRDIFTHKWGGFFTQCNSGASDCDACFASAPCAHVPSTEMKKEELTETSIISLTKETKVIESSAEDIQMILVGMDGGMDDTTIAAWKDSTAEYIKFYFKKNGNSISSLDVSLILQKQKFESLGRRNLRLLQSKTGKVVISYTQGNSYVIDGETEVDTEVLAKEPFATSDLRAEYMNRLRATRTPAFSFLTSVEVAKDAAEMKDIEEQTEIPEEEKEEIEDIEGAAKEEEEKVNPTLTILAILFFAPLVIACFVFCRSTKDLPNVGLDKSDMSKTSMYQKLDQSERSAAFDAPENMKRSYVVVYAASGELGITVDDSEGVPIIDAVSEMSPVAEKVFEGDRLIAVDDEDVKKLNSMEVSELIGEKSGNEKRKLSIIRFVAGGEDFPIVEPSMAVTSFQIGRSAASDASETTKTSYVVVYAASGELGITFDDSGEEPVVDTVSKMSPVAKKVFKGDRLIAVDDEDVKKLNAMEVAELIGEKSTNTTTKLSIIRLKKSVYSTKRLSLV